ncbi:hypothetical protein [Isoptericola nanjingensis]|uniref:hypothetical protein n=1 Tax=Isoptericola TaxID=254250 RepID=UPI0037BBDE2B|nr:hypothetical protein [Isoptericola sp. QY 916]
MTHDALTSRPGRRHDLLGELAAAQWAVEDVVSVVDGGLAIDLSRYLTARARLDAAVTAWNRRVGAGASTVEAR